MGLLEIRCNSALQGRYIVRAKAMSYISCLVNQSFRADISRLKPRVTVDEDYVTQPFRVEQKYGNR
jgi:hypothetical protein